MAMTTETHPAMCTMKAKLIGSPSLRFFQLYVVEEDPFPDFMAPGDVSIAPFSDGRKLCKRQTGNSLRERQQRGSLNEIGGYRIRLPNLIFQGFFLTL